MFVCNKADFDRQMGEDRMGVLINWVGNTGPLRHILGNMIIIQGVLWEAITEVIVSGSQWLAEKMGMWSMVHSLDLMLRARK